VLVMRRRPGESFFVGEVVEIEVLEVCGTRVKLGIVAPDSVSIQRKESQLTRDENIVAALSVEQKNISEILNCVAPRKRGTPVKRLTAVQLLTTDPRNSVKKH